MTVREAVRYGARALAEAGVANASNEARWLAQKAFSLSAAQLLIADGGANPEAWACYQDWITMRCAGKPLQYILGAQPFYGREFEVREGVLIPRPDTETLVREAVSWLQNRQAPRALDVCCGSGVIAVTLALECPHARVEASDIDEAAVALTRHNAARLGAAVTVRCADLLGGAAGLYDAIISNPPYATREEMAQLSPEVRHEPAIAIDGGEDGLAFYRRLALESMAHLQEDGRIFVEIGYRQAEALTAILQAHGWRDIHVVADEEGRDRVVAAGR